MIAHTGGKIQILWKLEGEWWKRTYYMQENV